jgi:type I restriction enzyme S subunit
LPQGWIWTEPQVVGEVAPRNQVDDGLATGFVPMTLVPLEFSGRVTHEVRPWGEIKKGYTHLADGDVGVAKITPCFQNRKSCVIRDLRNGVGAGTTELHVLRPNRRVVEPRFLLLFYRSARFVLEGVARMTGTAGQQRVPVEFFAAAPLPLPPLAEQKRIVARVDQLMALIDQLEAKQNRKREVGSRFTKASLEALTTAESPQEFTTAWTRIQSTWSTILDRPDKVWELKRVVLELAFSGRLAQERAGDTPVARIVQSIEENWSGFNRKEVLTDVADDEIPISPSRWKWIRLGNLAEVIGGVTKGRDLKGRKLSSIPYLRVANVQQGFLDLTEMKEIEIPAEELPKYRLEIGDVLFTEGGDWDKLGRSGVWVGEIKTCIHQNHVFRARLVSDFLAPAWVSAFANSSLGRRYFENAAKRTTNLASINMTQLRNCPIPVPPVEERERIVAKVEQLLKLCDALEVALRRSEDRAAKLVKAVVQEMVA